MILKNYRGAQTFWATENRNAWYPEHVFVSRNNNNNTTFITEKGSCKRINKKKKQLNLMRLPDDVLVVGNAILLPPFRRDLLTYDRDVNEALGILFFAYL